MKLVSALTATVLAVFLGMIATPRADLVHPAQATQTNAPGLPSAGIAALLPQAQQDNDDGPDILLMALLTTGAAAGAAVLGLAGYVVRNRIGFWLHRPPPREGGPPEEHH